MAHDIRIGTLVSGGQDDPAGYITQILPNGFECFEITFWETTAGKDLANLAAQLKGVCGTATISSLGIYGNPLGDQEKDAETVRSWERLIDNAHLFGASVICGFAGRVRGKKIDESMWRFKEVFGELAKRAEDKGLKLAFENCAMGGNWETGDYNIAHNPRAWEMMFDEVPSDALGLEWEPCHQMVALIDPLPQLRKWVKKVHHVHGKDATIYWDVVREQGVYSDQWFAYHRTPGFGDTNWADVISELRRGGYKGTIDIEGWHDPVYRDELEMTGQVRALNYLKECRGGDFVPNPS